MGVVLINQVEITNSNASLGLLENSWSSVLNLSWAQIFKNTLVGFNNKFYKCKALKTTIGRCDKKNQMETKLRRQFH